MSIYYSPFKAWRLFSNSVIWYRNRAFYALKCHSYSDFTSGWCCQRGNFTVAIMGTHVDRSVRGKFYFRTLPVSPYAMSTVRASTNCSLVPELNWVPRSAFPLEYVLDDREC